MSVLEQIKALENGNGIKYLLDSARRIFNNPVYMLDAYYNLIAASEGPDNVFLWSDLIRTGTLHVRVKEVMAKDGIFGIASALEKPVYLEKQENWSGGIMTMKIVNRNKNWVGQITMYDYFSPLLEDNLEAFGVLADKISNEIYDYEYFNKLPVVFFEDTINKLLDKSVENTLVHHSQAQLVRNELPKYLYVAVVKSDRKNFEENVFLNRLEYFKSLIKTKYPLYRYAVYKDTIVILAGSKEGDYKPALLFEKDYELFEHNSLYAGISSSFENIYDFRYYYDQAAAVLKQGMEGQSGSRVFISGLAE